MGLTGFFIEFIQIMKVFIVFADPACDINKNKTDIKNRNEHDENIG